MLAEFWICEKYLERLTLIKNTVIRLVDGNLVGDPLELEIFKSTGMEFVDGNQDPDLEETAGPFVQACFMGLSVNYFTAVTNKQLIFPPI